MSVELVLNELSLRTSFATVHEARVGMSQFIRTMVAATSKGIPSSLRTSVVIHAASLAPQYLLAQWRNDNDVNRDERSYFRSLVTKHPLLMEIDDAAREDALGLTDCTCSGDR